MGNNLEEGKTRGEEGVNKIRKREIEVRGEVRQGKTNVSTLGKVPYSGGVLE